MAKKSGLVENTVEETTPSAKVVAQETSVVDVPKVDTQTPGHSSRDFYTPING